MQFRETCTNQMLARDKKCAQAHARMYTHTHTHTHVNVHIRQTQPTDPVTPELTNRGTKCIAAVGCIAVFGGVGGACSAHSAASSAAFALPLAVVVLLLVRALAACKNAGSAHPCVYVCEGMYIYVHVCIYIYVHIDVWCVCYATDDPTRLMILETLEEIGRASERQEACLQATHAICQPCCCICSI